jgi:chemotaxis protein methyltransferase CheR
VQHLALALRPGGYLFLGHAETLRGVSQDFHLCHTHDTFYYRKRFDSEPPGGSLAAPAARREEDPAPLPAALEETTSRVAAIQPSAERVATPADDRRAVAPAASPAGVARLPAAPARELGPVLEALRQERFAEALALLHALPPETRGDPDALLLRAILLTNDGRLAESAEACGELLELDELNAGAHYVLALCREHAGDLAGAVEQDQTSVYLDPGFAMPHLHLGLLSKRSGDLETARRELGQAMILLEREDASRVLLFGGGFSRDALVRLCRSELKAAGGGR